MHGNLQGKTQGKCLDVGVDNYFNLFGEYKPFNLLEIDELLKDTPIQFITHHKGDTN